MLEVKRGPAIREKGNGIQDWDLFLRSYWLKKTISSSFYDDSNIHGNGCRCCTNTNVRTRNLREVAKRK